jgi:hypothetical protein
LTNSEISARWMELSLVVTFEEFLHSSKGISIISPKLEKASLSDYLFGYFEIKAALSFFSYSLTLEEMKSIMQGAIHSFLGEMAIYQG